MNADAQHAAAPGSLCAFLKDYWECNLSTRALIANRWARLRVTDTRLFQINSRLCVITHTHCCMCVCVCLCDSHQLDHKPWPPLHPLQMRHHISQLKPEKPESTNTQQESGWRDWWTERRCRRATRSRVFVSGRRRQLQSHKLRTNLGMRKNVVWWETKTKAQDRTCNRLVSSQQHNELLFHSKLICETSGWRSVCRRVTELRIVSRLIFQENHKRS